MGATPSVIFDTMGGRILRGILGGMMAGLPLVAILWLGVGASFAWAWQYKSQLSTLAGYYLYRENTRQGDFFMANEGAIGGLHYRGAFVFDNGLFIEPINISFYGGGHLRYRSSGTGRMDNVLYALIEIRAVGGYTVSFGGEGAEKNHNISIYTGLGYRHTAVRNGGERSNTGATAYDRVNHMAYLPLGIDYRFTYGRWSFGFGGEYDFFLAGQQESYFRHIFVAPNGHALGSASPMAIKNSQQNGYGMKFNITASYNGWFFSPFFNYWSIGVSKIASQLLPRCDYDGSNCAGQSTLSIEEPDNITIEAGARMGYLF
ncbi:MAG: hypothetical protein ORN57_01620 [Alphaproteobacteria bacterium]|nr:hypothetical protein [Alphaproteobacteria bacterium]